MKAFEGMVLMCFSCDFPLILSDGVECPYCGERYYLDPIDPRIIQHFQKYYYHINEDKTVVQVRQRKV